MESNTLATAPAIQDEILSVQRDIITLKLAFATLGEDYIKKEYPDYYNQSESLIARDAELRKKRMEDSRERYKKTMVSTIENGWAKKKKRRFL